MVDEIKDAVKGGCAGFVIEAVIILSIALIISFSSCASKKVVENKEIEKIDMCHEKTLKKEISREYDFSELLRRDTSLTTMVIVRRYYDYKDSISVLKQVDSLYLFNRKSSEAEETKEVVKIDEKKDSIESQSVREEVSKEETKVEKMNDTFKNISRILRASVALAILLALLWIRKRFEL